MQLAVFVNYDAGNLKLVDLDKADDFESCCDSIDQGIGDLIKFENGKYYQAIVEEEEEEVDEDNEDEEEPPYTWKIDWMPIS